MKVHITFTIAFNLKKSVLFLLYSWGEQWETVRNKNYTHLIDGNEQNWERRSRSSRQHLRESNQLRTTTRTCFQGPVPPQGPSSLTPLGVTDLRTFKLTLLFLVNIPQALVQCILFWGEKNLWTCECPPWIFEFRVPNSERLLRPQSRFFWKRKGRLMWNWSF